MGSAKDRLPGILAEIEEIAGRKNALAIAQTNGGQYKKFPTASAMRKSPDNYRGNWLVLAVGFEAALKIAEELFPGGGLSMDIPFARHALRRDFIRENGSKLSASEMAICLNITERAVRRLKADIAGDAE